MPLKPQSLEDLEYRYETYRNGTRREEWLWQDQLHSINDHPAVIVDGGAEKMWYTHGLRNRDSGPAWIKRDTGFQTYYSNDLVHRNDGPAMISLDSEKWYEHGQLGRRDGPAVIWRDGKIEWWFAGVAYKNMDDWGKMTGVDDELFVMIKLEFG